MKKFLFSFILSFPIFALPRFAAENGTSCNLCHINPAGAGLRNDYGISLFSMEELPMEKGMKFTDEDYTGMILENLRFGADLRFQVLSQTDNQEESLTAYFPMQGDLYGNLTVSKGVEVYVKQDVLRQQPEFWSYLPILPNDGYIKIGKFIPTFGLRLDDHTAFTRGGTPHLKTEGMPFSPIAGNEGIIEAGMYISNVYVTLSTANKYIDWSEKEVEFEFSKILKDKNLTFRGEYTGSIGSTSVLFGSSFMKEGNFQLMGLFGGTSFLGLTWIGEVDIAENWIDDNTSLASFSEFSYPLKQGLHFVARYDLFDEDIKIKNNAISRWTVGTDVFPLSFFEIKLQGRFTSLSGDGENPEPEYLIQFHTWF